MQCILTHLSGLNNGGRYLQCEKLWETLQQAWEKYPEEKIARTFVYHEQVACAIYDCNGGDEFVHQRNGLSFGVRKVCRPWYGEDEKGEEDALDLSSLAPRNQRKAMGVIVEEINDGVDIDSEDVRSLRYPRPNIRQHNIAEHLTYNELQLICEDPGDVDYDNLSGDEQMRYNAFGEAWEAKMESEGPAPLPVPTTEEIAYYHVQALAEGR